MGEGKLLNRQIWLKANGFERDPFLRESFHAETDTLLIEDLWLESYVDMPDAKLLIGELIGDYYIPGSRFIFSGYGGGKSGIRKRIHLESEKVDLFEDKPKVLVVDYTKHDYPIKESSVRHHVNRIVSLAEAVLNENKERFSNKTLTCGGSPKSMLKKLLAICEDLGYKGIYILVDDLNIQTYEKILPLALSTDLNKIKGVIIKFFIPEDLLLLAQLTLPFQEFKPYVLRWKEKELSQILSQRLLLCLRLDIKLRTSIPGISFLCDVSLSTTIQDYFISIGKVGGPGIMWKFGYYLFEEHIKNIEQVTDLINNLAFEKARLRLFDDLLNINKPVDYSLIEDLQNKYRDVLKKSASHGTKAKVFLCCIPEDREVVYNLLYKPLETENYRPQMIELEISPGENWKYVMEKMIEESDFFLPCFSTKTFKKKSQFHAALDFAKEANRDMPMEWIFIIPTYIENCNISDSELKKLSFLDLNNKDFFLTLLKSLEKGMKIKKGKII